MHRDLVQKVPFFQDKDPGFVSFIVPNMKNVSFKAGEVVFQEGEHADEVYFILEGRIAFQTAQGAVFRTYIPGSYFGEVDILENLSRSYTAQVTSKTAELLIMTKANLWKMMEEFPQIALEIIETAREKEQRNQESLKNIREVFKLDSPETSLQGKLENFHTDGIITQRQYRRRRSVNGTMDLDPLEKRHTGFTVKILRSADRVDEKQAYWDKLKEKYSQPEPLLSLNTPGGSDSPATPHTRGDGNADFTAQAMPLFSPQSPNASPKSHLDEMANLWKGRKEAVEEQFEGTRKVMEMIAKRQVELRNMMQIIAEKRDKAS
jgi:CRP-like cAMP-binding protein